MRTTINNGSALGDGTGEPVRDAFTKVNAMFLEVYGNVYASVADVAGMIDLTAASGVEKVKALLSTPLAAANTLKIAGPDVNEVFFVAMLGPAPCVLTFNGVTNYYTVIPGTGDVMQVPADVTGEFLHVHAVKVGSNWMATVQIFKGALS